MAKGVKTGGRQKGSKNKVTVEREALSDLRSLPRAVRTKRHRSRQPR